MMKLQTGWTKFHKYVSLIADDKNPDSRELSIESNKRRHYWGYKHEEDFNCHSFGFYLFEVCYYARGSYA